MKFFRPGYLWLCLATTSGASLCNGQTSVQLRMVAADASTSEATVWLPRRHSESMGPYLEKIVAHAESRRLCPKLLEARLAGDSDLDNPEFIITCKLDNLQTVNLIYSRQDVLEDFRNVSYEHKDTVVVEPAQLLLDAMGPSRIEQAKDACKQTVRTDARDGDRASLPDNDNIDIRPRQDNKIAVFVKYYIGQRGPGMNFTATCVVDEDNQVAMEVYPH